MIETLWAIQNEICRYMEKGSSDIYHLSAFIGNEVRDMTDLGYWGYDNLRFKMRSSTKNMEHIVGFIRR